MSTDMPRIEWRGPFDNDELDALHAEAFAQQRAGADWAARLRSHSLGWVCMRLSGKLVGFVNVAWDGGGHAFLVDTAVTPSLRRRGLGRRLVSEAVDHAKASGCEWLHVDFEPGLREFYIDACGFRPTQAGLLRLR